MDPSTMTIFITVIIGFTGLAIGLFAGLATLWTGVRNELREMGVRVSETELEQARQEGANRVLERFAHGHETATGGEVSNGKASSGD